MLAIDYETSAIPAESTPNLLINNAIDGNSLRKDDSQVVDLKGGNTYPGTTDET